MPTATRFRRRLTATALVLAAALATFPTGSRGQMSASEMMRINGELTEASRLQSQGKHEPAIAILEGTLRRVKPLVKPDDPVIGVLKSSLGSLYGYGGRYKEAEAMFREAIVIGRPLSGPEGEFRFQARDGLIQILVALGKYDEALPLAEGALKDDEARHGADDLKTNQTRDILANVYLFVKRPDAAIPLSRRSLKAAELAYKGDDPRTIHSRNVLATALTNSGKYDEAKALFETSLAIARKRLPSNHEDFISSLSGLAACNQAMGREKEAADLGKEVGEAAGRPGVSPDHVVDALNIEAVTAASRGDLEKAESAYKKALQIGREKLGPEHPKTAGLVLNLAGLYITMGRYAEGERFARQALGLLEKNPGPDTVPAAKAANTLALIYFRTARYRDAMPLLERAEKILSREYEDGHPEIAYIRHNLAQIYMSTNNYADSAELSEKSLESVVRRLGPDNRMAGSILVNLGASYGYLLQFGKAETAFRRAVAIFDKIDPGSSDASIADSALSEVCRMNGKLDEAEALARRAVAASTNRYGLNHPEPATQLDNLAMLLAGQGRTADAAKEADRARRSWRTFLLKTLPAFTEGDQLAMIAAGERDSLDGALTLALERRSEPGIAPRSAEWVLNSKAITLRALATRGVLARDTNDPETARIAAELEATRNRLAMLAFARPGFDDSPAATATDDYKRVDAHERELSRRLGLTLHLPEGVDDWVDLSQVRDRIPADAVLVEFARVRVTLFAVKEIFKKGLLGPRYAAWVIPPTGRGEVTLIDLGPADALERDVSEALRAVQPDPARPLLPGNGPADERRALVALGTLSDHLYGPLRAHLEPARRWLICPDAALWFVPWAAVPVGGGRYAVERHLIQLAVSGRGLIEARAAAEAAPPAVLADPDYDLDPGLVRAEARKVVREKAAGRAANAPRAPLRSVSLADTVPRLKFPQQEAEAITPLMAAYAGAAPRVFLEGAASETVFKALRGPRVLVLSTHGFFLRGPESAADSRPPLFGPIPLARTEANLPGPLLRCGLILAGYNRRSENRGADDTDDGLLTGMEVVSVDLRGTDLVVLSACETGLGDVRAGEGVAGLRQVFQLAGAGGVVASLWNVQDFESYQLMSALFHGLARRRGPAAALREAQLALIRDLRSRTGAAHPTYWAAFALTGSPGPNWRDEPLTDTDSPDLPPLPSWRPDSPVTGRPESGSPWSDAALAAVLASVGGHAGRLWWRRSGLGAGR